MCKAKSLLSILRGLVSGAANTRFNHSISAIVCSVSTPSQSFNKSAATVKRDGINDVSARVADHGESRHAKTLDRCAGCSAIDVRQDDQFEDGDIRELNAIFLDLTDCV